jgi:Zn-dependent protease with chaperone function
MTHQRNTRTLTALYVACTTVRVAGSLGVLLAAFGWLGPWSGPVLLGWLVATPVLRTAAGERRIVRLGRGFHALSVTDRETLAPVTADVLARSDLTAERIEWYVRRGDSSINAYAAGRRSIAISEGLLHACTVGNIGADEVAGILGHEVGHLLDPTSRRRLLVAWLTGPWRMFQALLVLLVKMIARRAPGGRAGLLVLPVVMVSAAVQLIQVRAWAPLVGIVGLVIGVGLTPLVDAAMSRRAELAADDYAADAGVAPNLAAVLARSQRAPSGRIARLYEHHPPVSLRIERLTAQR